uniref:Uncharacterized protein n=1 Tax=viral metagenome TaxID=1070528 RepID=A0A6H1ZSP5_9ZZZZ
MRQLIQEVQPVVGLTPGAITGAVTVDTISLANYQHVTIFLQVTKGAGTETGAVALTQDTAVTATAAKALGFDWVWKTADAATTDVPVKTAVTSDTFNMGGVASKNSLFVIEIDSDSLDVDNDFDCLTLTLGTLVTGTASVLYVLSQPRFIDQTTHITAIA